MRKVTSISAEKLRSMLPTAHVPYESSADIPRAIKMIAPQPRALQALELALSIKNSGYNVYLAGEVNLGRSYMVQDFLKPKAKKYPTPPDLIYVYNFDEPDNPLLISIPGGQGKKFKKAINAAIAKIRKDLPAHMERDSYNKKRNSLMNSFQSKKSKIVEHMDKIAATHGFKLDVDEGGAMTLYPLVEGKRISEQDFDGLDDIKKGLLKQQGDDLAQTMQPHMRKLGRMEQDLMDDERNLEKEVALELISTILDPLIEKFKGVFNGNLPEGYFQKLKDDIVENLDFFLPSEPPVQLQSSTPLGSSGHEGPHFDEIAYRYDVNIFVDNSATVGAPIITDDHPTAGNLLGSIERESEMGALVTNFTLIKAGSLHRANGGFLILQIEDIIQHPSAWEGLLRALRSGQAKVDDIGEGEGIKTKGLRPAPLNLDLKVILIGTEELYEILLANDSRFNKLFKVKAQMSGRMPRNAKGVKTYLQNMQRIIDEAGLLHFDREALAELIDFGSMLVEDQKQLSLEFPLIRDLMVEASAQTKISGGTLVTREYLQKALDDREFRMNLVEEAFMEEYDRKIIKVITSGEAIGRVNGLSVTSYGNFEFGLPHQISCTVGVGHGGIIDLEREAELGGPIHTKAIMILKSYLVALFARKKPIILTGSIHFEQSYAGVEGDSASGAELAALLSALSNTPIDLNLAFTGALGQTGQIMAVGGVSHKVAGFFEVCRRHGLTGRQGVLLPKDNLEHLILKPHVLEAIEKGQFHIYPITHIREAMELLTSIPYGTMRKDGSFTPGSLLHRADQRVAELAKLAKKHS